MKIKTKKLIESKPKKNKNKKKTVSKSNAPSTKIKKGKLGIKKKNVKKTSKRLLIENNEVTFSNINTTEHEYNRPNDEILLISKSEVDNFEKMEIQQNPMDKESNINEDIPATNGNLNQVNSTLTVQNNKKTNKNQDSTFEKMNNNENILVDDQITEQQIENNGLVKNSSDESSDKICVNQKTQISKNKKTENGITSAFDDARKNPFTHTKCDERKTRNQFKRT